MLLSHHNNVLMVWFRNKNHLVWLKIAYLICLPQKHLEIPSLVATQKVGDGSPSREKKPTFGRHKNSWKSLVKPTLDVSVVFRNMHC